MISISVSVSIYLAQFISNVCTGSVSDTSMASIPGGSDEIVSHFSVPVGPSSTNAKPDSFKTEFHPKSGRPATVDSFSTFDRRSQHKPSLSTTGDSSEPWHPFQTLGDFEFSEIAHKAALNKEQTNKLLALIRQVSKGETKITLESHHEVTEAWKRAAKTMTPVRSLTEFPCRRDGLRNEITC